MIDRLIDKYIERDREIANFSQLLTGYHLFNHHIHVAKKYMTKNKNKKETFWFIVEGYSPTRQGSYGNRSLRQPVMLLLQTGRTNGTAGAPLTSFFLLSTEPRIIAWCCPHSEWVILLQFSSSRNFLIAMSKFITYAVPEPTKWIITISHHIVHFTNIRMWAVHVPG